MNGFFKSTFWYFLLGQLTVIAINSVLALLFLSTEAKERADTASWRTAMETRVVSLEKAIKQVEVIKKKVDQPKVMSR